MQQDDDRQPWTNKVRETHQVIYPNLVFSASLDLMEDLVGQEDSKIYFGFYGLPMKRRQHSHLTSLAISYQNSGCSISDQLEVLSSSGQLITLNHNSPVWKEHMG